MRLIKVAGFLFQFGLIGLALAVIYLFAATDRSKDDILEFLSSSDRRELQQQAADGSSVGAFSYADAVASSVPSVVTIYTSRTIEEKPHPLLEDPVFSQFFGDQLERRQRSRNETNLGSGVLIGADGYILTNQHVIDGADEILILLADGRGSQAVLIGQDRETDIAILQIPMSGLSGIRVADSRSVRVGDVVLAIGNPLNVGQTVTMGIVSATGRNRIGLNTFENFIQTDAAINPGNSGGALVNARGELVGINTAIFSQAVGAQGIGFAIPISLALDIMKEIIEFGKVTRGWLGVEGTGVTARAAMATGDPGIKGALIVGVFINSPADMAGIRAGDIVVAVNGRPVLGIRDLLDQITLFKPGDEIQVTIYRGPQKQTLAMTVVPRPQ
ncbi:MAG: trypsin-like peptidase domain-containing protein [Gammaproteobacteria bacterium]|nr:trypsin-like peptidase domain-containing protein [Gammaproteobacteria bacterium]MDH3537559.1 trypsin-like peptidase domain-containing protein [Gammaproteobacteria bacterium]